MLRKSLIQFYADGWMATFFKRTFASNCCSQDSCSQFPWLCSRPLSTQNSARESCTLTGKSGPVFWGIIAPSSWVLVNTRICCSIQESDSLGVLILLLNPQAGNSLVGPRTFATVWKFLWYSCSLVCGSSALQLYRGTNGNLLQEDSCHTHCASLVGCSQSLCPTAGHC